MTSTEWTQGLTPDQQENIKKLLKTAGGNPLFRRFMDILVTWEDTLDRAEYSTSDYDTPAWSHKQAHRNGDRARIQRVKNLFSFIS